MNVTLQSEDGPCTASTWRRTIRHTLRAALVAGVTGLCLVSGAEAPASAAALSPTPFGDMDGDGWSDLLVRNTTSGDLTLYRGTRGGLRAPLRVGRGWNGMDAITRHGDMDGDGHEDVVAREARTGALWLYPGTGTSGEISPAFARRLRIGAGGWNAMKEITPAGDLDGDGRGDLLAVRAATGELFLYPGRGASLGRPRLFGRGWSAMDELTGMGDIDHDGHVDLLARQMDTGDVWAYPATGFGSSARLGARTMVGAGAAGWRRMDSFAGLGDVDRDGWNDLVAVDAFAAWTSRVYGLRNGRLQAVSEYGPGWRRHLRPIL